MRLLQALALLYAVPGVGWAVATLAILCTTGTTASCR
jgi:hypothetical protein